MAVKGQTSHPSSIESAGFINSISNIEFFPLGMLAFEFEGRRYTLETDNKAFEISESQYRNLKKWASQNNKIKTKLIDDLNLVHGAEDYESYEGEHAENLRKLKKTLSIRQEVFGADFENPFKNPLYGSLLTAKTKSKANRAGSSDKVIISLSPPSIFYLDSICCIENVEFAEEKKAITGAELTKLKKNSFPLPVFSEGIETKLSLPSAIVRDKKTAKFYVCPVGIYFWPDNFEIEFVSEEEILKTKDFTWEQIPFEHPELYHCHF